MKLYQYDHCPYCVRVKMLLGRKKFPYETITIGYDDVQTPTNIIGKKLLPILIKDDGTAMGESLDIVKYLDNLDEKPILSHKKLPDNINAALRILRQSANKLYKPRIVSVNINDFSTSAAVAYYENKWIKRNKINFDECLKQTETLLLEAQAQLDIISSLLGDGKNIYNTMFSMADIHLFPVLRNLSVVKDLQLTDRLRAYMQYQAEQADLELFFDQAM